MPSSAPSAPNFRKSRLETSRRKGPPEWLACQPSWSSPISNLDLESTGLPDFTHQHSSAQICHSPLSRVGRSFLYFASDFCSAAAESAFDPPGLRPPLQQPRSPSSLARGSLLLYLARPLDTFGRFDERRDHRTEGRGWNDADEAAPGGQSQASRARRWSAGAEGQPGGGRPGQSINLDRRRGRTRW